MLDETMIDDYVDLVKLEHKYNKTMRRMVIAVIAVFLLQALSIYYYVSTVQPPPSPATIVVIPEIVQLPDPYVCPHDTVSYMLSIDILSPSVIETTINIIDEDGVMTGNVGATIPGSETSLPARARDKVEKITQLVTWTVPDLKPGAYRRATGLTPQNRGAVPAIVSVPFEVMENCPP